LGKACHIDDACPLPLEMSRHAEDTTDRHDAGSADTGNDDVVGAVNSRQIGLGQRRTCTVLRHAFPLLQRGAVHRHERWAKAFDAGEILVARGLVDGALAAEFGFKRLDRNAVRLNAAVTATLADKFVDDDALVGIRKPKLCSRW